MAKEVKVSWPILVSTGSLIFALVGGAWGLITAQVRTEEARVNAAIDSVRREMADLKELTASERLALARRLENDERDTAIIRDNKVDNARFNQVVGRLMTKEEEETRFR